MPGGVRFVMTWMLASVRDVGEARMMLETGADIIDLKEPAAGALGALSHSTVREVVAALGGRVPVSATIGNVDTGDADLELAVAEMAGAGAQIVKIGVFGPPDPAGLRRRLCKLADEGFRVALVIFAERGAFELDFAELAADGVVGVMLDTMDKESGSLLQKMPVPALGRFVREARQAGLLAGLAGALQAEDIPELLPLQADYLGFRSALCKGDQRKERICSRRAQIVRALIPFEGPASEAGRKRGAA
jgi:(5-formylfuran-3-yl)methyl phosphate synthase